MELSMKEISQVVTFEKIKSGVLSKTAAAKLLKCSVRWVRKKYKRYVESGPIGLTHRTRGRSSPRITNPAHIKLAMDLLRGQFHGFGPTFASEKLEELYHIKLSREVLRKAMIKHSLWHDKKIKSKHRCRRERKEFFGHMVQLDGSPHDWFEGRASKCTLLVFIDDATSWIVHMALTTGETTENAMRELQTYVKTAGRPLSLYVDFGSVFSVNTSNPDRNKITQFKRACNELDIEIIHARSPQAKGRVERSNQTHQDRLIKELRLANISTLEQANCFIRDVYLPKHNALYAVAAAKDGDVHRPIDGFDLTSIFCIKVQRIIQNDFTLQYNKRILQLNSNQRAVVRPKELVTISKHLDGSLSLSIRSIELAFHELFSRPCKDKPEPKPWVPQKPAANHPWRKTNPCRKTSIQMEVI